MMVMSVAEKENSFFTQEAECVVTDCKQLQLHKNNVYDRLKLLKQLVIRMVTTFDVIMQNVTKMS